MTSELAIPQSAPLDTNPCAVYLAGLTAMGRKSMTYKLGTAAKALGYSDPFATPWADLRFQHVMAVRSQLQESGLAPATINAILAALKGVARAAFNLGMLSGDDFERIRSVKPVAGTREPAGRMLSNKELNRLMRACKDAGASGYRDAAILALLYGCGLRRSEVAAADLVDLSIDDSGWSGSLCVHGKGNRERRAYLNHETVEYLRGWLRHRGEEPGPLFCPINKGGRIVLRRITDQAVYGALQRRAEIAGILGITPHDLRRTFASNLLDSGADISVVQKLMGHANVQTTIGYDRRGESALRQAAGMLFVPHYHLDHEPKPPTKDTDELAFEEDPPGI